MSIIRVATNFNIDLEFQAAPFHRRLLAWLIDMILLVFYMILMSRFLTAHIDKGSIDYVYISILLFLFIVPVLTYHLISEILMNGQSVGKKIMGIKVVAENGGRPNISQYIIRWLIRTSDLTALSIIISSVEADRTGQTKYLMQVGVAFCLLITDVILVNASKKQQRLGDMLAHTILIRTKEEADIQQTIFQEVSHNYVPSFPQIMHLSDRDMNALKGILETAKRRGDYNMAELASEKIKAHLKIQTELSAFEFLEVLLKDYNYLSAH